MALELLVKIMEIKTSIATINIVKLMRLITSCYGKERVNDLLVHQGLVKTLMSLTH